MSVRKIALVLLLLVLPALSAAAQSPNYGSGFTASGLSLNGGATITSSAALQLTDGGGNEARTAFFTTPVDVQSFTNNFTFQLTSANADGFTFTIQGIGPTAVGSMGGGLGYAGIGNSVAVGFQLYSAGKEVSLTGDWTNGASPDATPGSSTTGSGVSLHNGDVMSVHMTYNGTTLTWTITDTATGKTFTKSVTINIPALTGNAAYVGFTGGSGGLTAVQNILTWTYTSGSSPVPPSITTQPANQTVAPGQTATFSVTASGTAPLSYQWQQNTGTGFMPISGATSSSYTTPPTTSSNNGNTFDVIVSNSVSSVTSNAAILTVSSTTPAVNYGSGFTASGLSLNGGATITSSAALQLTDGGGNEARTAFFTTPVNVQSFVSTFTFRLTNANADGFTFTIQGIGPTAVGSMGGGLGYAGIGNSVAVGFQLYRAGKAVSLTGLWTNGASPSATPGTSMSGASINLHSGDVFKVIVSYNGTTLSMYIRDLTNSSEHFFMSFPLDIPGTVGSNTAYMGFTGGDGGLTSTQNILSWSYSGSETGTSGAFIWPVDSPAVVGSSDYSTTAFGDQYHTGIDLCPGALGCKTGDPVYAAADGTVQAVYVTPDPAQTMCDGRSTGSLPTDNNHLGNTVIIAHSNGKFSLYGNLDCVWPGIAPGVAVTQGERIANIGNSQYSTRTNTWTPHMHFEIKDTGVIADPATGAFASFTPDLPDGYGYHDPRVYLFPFSQTSMSPTAVKVMAPFLDVLTGPDTTYSSLAFVTAGQEFVAFASSGSWYEIYLPNSEGPISGWIPASAGGQILAAPDSTATEIQVSNTGSAGLLVRPSASAATNLVSWNNNSSFVPTVQNCAPAAKVWDGQVFVWLAAQNGFNEFYLPSNFYFSSANTCAQPSTPGPSVGWASSTYIH